ncbi:unnamed protein product [Didymodactylos carnosus]|uniref:Uncharacterized protein n=1 Tax=Didymodactylos carnosus TaxID=1234261 RepID=A0A813V9M7_9BILA|nr:unnamed protein product [Didymodactylos carnosus]CAF1064882.1 unnamed protein product [Didymodactylos carnosus]CAF3629410.1 unnamed protein product [Didymodactylos carnosus]CAF3829994.1 unnamed protein product [Didymodactylos carnosus]
MTKVAVGIILLGISTKYVIDNKKDSTTSVTVPTTKDGKDNSNIITAAVQATSTLHHDDIYEEKDKLHVRSLSVSSDLETRNSNPFIGDFNNNSNKNDINLLSTTNENLNETSFRDAPDNYGCLLTDQCCIPTQTFLKNEKSNENNSGDQMTMTISTVISSSSKAKTSSDLDDIERFKMCGNSII